MGTIIKRIIIIALVTFVMPFLPGMSLASLTPSADGTRVDVEDCEYYIGWHCDYYGYIENGINVEYYYSSYCPGPPWCYYQIYVYAGIIEFDISSLDGLFASGQMKAILTFTVLEGGDFQEDRCVSLYSIADGSENGIIEVTDSNLDYIGEVCGAFHPGDIITIEVTSAVEHDLFDPDQTDFSGFVLDRTPSWGDEEDYITFYDRTDSMNAPTLSVFEFIDTDDDDIADDEDNCPNDYNPNQEDNDQDNVGDVCDPDDDNDGLCDPGESDPSCTSSDNCPRDYNPGQEDADTDAKGDMCDNCPSTPNGPLLGTCTWSEVITCTTVNNCDAGGSCNMNQEDSDGDAIGDVCDECTDTDGDGYGNPQFLATTCTLDNCPNDPNPDQEDNDSDSLGDVCDPDNDNDGICDPGTSDPSCSGLDNCPYNYNPNQEDIGDGDGIGDICDNCQYDDNPDQTDIDEDGIGDECDACPHDPENDIDADDICGDSDNCPSKPNGPNGGTCIWGENIGAFCTIQGYDPMECGEGGFCSKNQEDTSPPQGNGIGDACDCECDFTCDGDVDADDVTAFIADFGREPSYRACTNANPCKGDTDCDVDVDADDVNKFIEDFGREPSFRPCPACTQGAWCVYE